MPVDLDAVARVVVKFLTDKGHLTNPMDALDIASELRGLLSGPAPSTMPGHERVPTEPHVTVPSTGEMQVAERAARAAQTWETTKPPAVDPKKSIHDDYLICLEDGERVVLLRRHLKTRYNMTPDQYRIKWNLPADYPMVAPKFAERKSDLAKLNGFGRSHRKQFKEHYDMVKRRLREEKKAIAEKAALATADASSP